MSMIYKQTAEDTIKGHRLTNKEFWQTVHLEIDRATELQKDFDEIVSAFAVKDIE